MFQPTIVPICVLLLLCAVANGIRRECPPCPAQPPCRCIVLKSEAFQLLSCPQTEFPSLRDASANFTADHYCDLRIVNSSFTEIPANAFAQVHRFHVEIGETNSRFSLLKAFAFNGSSVREVELRFTPSSTVAFETSAFASDIEELILYSANGTVQVSQDAFRGAEDLRTLGVSTSSIPSGFFQHLTALEELNIQSWGRALSIEPGAFTGLVNLEMLSLHPVEPTTIQRQLFDGLSPRLHHLTMGGQNLPLQAKPALLPDDVFTDQKGLDYVSLRNLQLGTIPASLLKLKNITHLNLEENQLTSEDLDSKVNASHWKFLRRIDLGLNSLETVPKFLQQLKSLTTATVQSSAHVNQTRLFCDAQLCWLGDWSAVFQNESAATSKAVSLQATCLLKQCKGPMHTAMLADVKEFVARSGVCNVSADLQTNFPPANPQLPQTSWADVMRTVTMDCSSQVAGDKKDANANAQPLKSGSAIIGGTYLGILLLTGIVISFPARISR